MADPNDFLDDPEAAEAEAYASEMEEILGMSDRVIVMHEGQISGELSREALNEEAVMHLATTSPMHTSP